MTTKSTFISDSATIHVPRHSSNETVIGMVGDVEEALAGYQIRRGHYETQQAGQVVALSLVFGPAEEVQPLEWLGEWARRMEI